MQLDIIFFEILISIALKISALECIFISDILIPFFVTVYFSLFLKLGGV